MVGLSADVGSVSLVPWHHDRMPPTTGWPHDAVFDLDNTNSLKALRCEPTVLIRLVNEGVGRHFRLYS